jgi:hypothetical protein
MIFTWILRVFFGREYDWDEDNDNDNEQVGLESGQDF